MAQSFWRLDLRLKRRGLCPVNFVMAREKCAACAHHHSKRRSPKRFAILAMLALLSPARGEVPAPGPAIAVLDFGYKDTSGEPRDQTAEHQERLDRFMASLRADLAAGAKFRVVSMTCRIAPCSLSNAPPLEIFSQAKQAGAQFIIFGEIQKVSTLIQLGNFHVVDVETNTPVIDRILSFRGDSDQAWRRAEDFLVKELKDGIHPK